MISISSPGNHPHPKLYVFSVFVKGIFRGAITPAHKDFHREKRKQPKPSKILQGEVCCMKILYFNEDFFMQIFDDTAWNYCSHAAALKALIINLPLLHTAHTMVITINRINSTRSAPFRLRSSATISQFTWPWVKFTVYALLKYTYLKTLGLHITAPCVLEQKVIDARARIASASPRVYCPVFPSGLNQYTSDITVMQGSGRVGDSEWAPRAGHRVTRYLWLHIPPLPAKMWNVPPSA